MRGFSVYYRREQLVWAGYFFITIIDMQFADVCKTTSFPIDIMTFLILMVAMGIRGSVNCSYYMKKQLKYSHDQGCSHIKGAVFCLGGEMRRGES